MSIRTLFLILLFFLFSACEEKRTPILKKSATLQTPISCMRLNPLMEGEEFVDLLKQYYPFKRECPLTLTLSYKRDIVCNSTYNALSKNMGKFPKSFIKLELRKGLEVVYSYYVDLYSNVDEDDLIEGMNQLKKDLLSK